MICENCGSKMSFKKDGHSICWICDNCGAALAATCFEPYETDLTVYHILIASPFKANTDILKLVSEIANCNYIEAKKMIENAPTEIFRGNAVEIKEIKQKLESASIDFKIEPKFPY